MTKEDIANNLEKLRRRICAYSMPDFCDCKYGADLHLNSEMTGCPELRYMIALLKSMSEAEFMKLSKRKPMKKRSMAVENEKLREALLLARNYIMRYDDGTFIHTDLAKVDEALGFRMPPKEPRG